VAEREGISKEKATKWRMNLRLGQTVDALKDTVLSTMAYK
jgi:hypothetical protein